MCIRDRNLANDVNGVECLAESSGRGQSLEKAVIGGGDIKRSRALNGADDAEALLVLLADFDAGERVRDKLLHRRLERLLGAGDGLTTDVDRAQLRKIHKPARVDQSLVRKGSAFLG